MRAEHVPTLLNGNPEARQAYEKNQTSITFVPRHEKKKIQVVQFPPGFDFVDGRSSVASPASIDDIQGRSEPPFAGK